MNYNNRIADNKISKWNERFVYDRAVYNFKREDFKAENKVQFVLKVEKWIRKTVKDLLIDSLDFLVSH